MVTRVLCCIVSVGALAAAYGGDAQGLPAQQLRHLAQGSWGEGTALPWSKRVVFTGYEGRLAFCDPKYGRIGFLSPGGKEEDVIEGVLTRRDVKSVITSIRKSTEGPISIERIFPLADSMCARGGLLYLRVYWGLFGKNKRQIVQCVRDGRVVWTWARKWGAYRRDVRDALAMLSDTEVALVRPDYPERVAIFDRRGGFIGQIAFPRPVGSDLRSEDLPLTVEEEVKRRRPLWTGGPRIEARLPELRLRQSLDSLRSHSKYVVEKRLKRLGKEKEWLLKTKRIDVAIGTISSVYAMEDGSLVAVGISRERAVWFTRDGEVVAQWPPKSDKQASKPNGRAAKRTPIRDKAPAVSTPMVIGAGWNAIMIYEPLKRTVQLVDRQSRVVAEVSMVFPDDRASIVDQRDALTNFGRDARGLQMDEKTFAVIYRPRIYFLTLAPRARDVRHPNDPPRRPLKVTVEREQSETTPRKRRFSW